MMAEAYLQKRCWILVHATKISTYVGTNPESNVIIFYGSAS